MHRLTSLLLALALLAFPPVASAQDAADPGTDIFEDGLVAPDLEFSEQPAGEFDPIPYSPAEAAPLPDLVPGVQHDLILEARLREGGPAVREGVVWRIFGSEPDAEGSLPLLGTVEGGTTRIRVESGKYLVHAAFGRAGITKRIVVAGDDQTESLVLNAGGMRLDAVVGEDQAIAPDRLSFEILQEDVNGELVSVIPRAAAGRVLRLGAGTYHVISRYGAVNAVVRADIQVEPGKLTEAVMRHTGAQVILKLVSEEGGEALANTVWTVLSQDGNTIHESIGAFPSIILAAGDYSAVATHQEQVYSRDFTVESGVDRDIEVRLTDLIQPEAEPGTLSEISGAPMQP